jgi:signal peptidase II
VPSGDADPGPGLRRRGALVVGIVSGVVALDQGTKAWAVDSLARAPVSLIGTTVEFRLSRNPGSAFSLFQTLTPLLAVLAVAIAVVLVRALRRTDDRTVVVALALVLAGAVGNLGDRVFRSPGWLRGAVVDFIHLDGWPTFNVADSAITIGAVVLVAWSLLASRPQSHDA